MPKHFRRYTALLLLLAAATTAAVAHSASSNAYGDRAMENLAIALVIDTSASMSYTDPGRLRETAADMFIDLLGPLDRLAIITFDQKVHRVVPLQQLGGAASKAQFKAALASRLDPGGYTDYTAALQAAFDELAAVNKEELRPVVVFLTDGDPLPDELYRSDPHYRQAYLEIMWETVNRFTAAGLPVYTIAFSDEIGPAIIEKISLLTRGGHYLLDTPQKLLASFFELLETLKNRQRLIDRQATLEGDAQTFAFRVEPEALQVNLVIENQAGGGFDLSLKPPPGVQSRGDNPSIIRGRDYAMILFHEPGEAMQGQWEATISGSGVFKILGSADNPLKAWILQPSSGAIIPAGEEIPLEVHLSGLDSHSGRSPEVLLQVTGPELERPQQVSLQKDGNIYTGSYNFTDRPGVYEILVTVACDGKTAARASAQVYVRSLPRPEAEFQLKNSYRLGEALAPEASLFLGSHRISGGGELEMNYYNFVLDYGGGTRVTVPLLEGGASGQLKDTPRDGFWSNRFTLNLEGEATAILQAVGRYRGEDFLLEKNLGPVAVHRAGRIIVTPGRGRLCAAPGRSLILPLTVKNCSPFEETLKIYLPPGGALSTPETGFTLKPGQAITAALKIEVSPSAALGTHALPLRLEAAHPLTVVEAAELNRAVEILTPTGYLLYRFTAPGPATLFLKGIFFCVLMLFGGGLLLYYLLVYPGERPGQLHYYRDNATDATPPPEEKLALSRLRKNTAVISFDPENKGDFFIPGSEYAYSLIITVQPAGRLPRFLKGWQALLKKGTPVRKILRATPPGIVEKDGQVFTCLELEHGMIFQSGGFTFRYEEPRLKAPEQEHRGVNILEGKM